MGEPRRSGRPRSAGTRIGHAVRPGATRWPGPSELLVTVGVAIVAVAAAILNVTPVVRVPLGLAATLFLPGYALSLVLFPKDRVDGIERAALAVTLSLGSIVVAALLVNLTPGRLSGAGLVTAVTAVTLGACAIGWKRSQMPACGPVPLRIDRPRALSLGDAPQRWPAVVVGAAAILLVLALGTRMPGAADTTEFYLVGEGGRIDTGAGAIQAGRPTTITVGLTNHAGAAASFRVRVEWQGSRLAAAGPVDVAEGGSWTGSLSFTAPRSGSGVPIEIHLYAGADEEPLRSLRLVMTGEPPSQAPPSAAPASSAPSPAGT
jgi:hypothetical protein